MQVIVDDIQFQEELKKPGVLVIDVFSKFAGVCEPIAFAFAKKWKTEYGDDTCRFIQAQSDEIKELEPFRNKSKPHFFVYVNGILVDVISGPNAPGLDKSVKSQVEVFKSNRTPVPFSKDSQDIVQVAKLTAKSEASVFVIPEPSVGEEYTLALIKPDSIGKVDEIKQAIKQSGFKVVKEKRFAFSVPQASKFYQQHQLKPFFANLVHYMTSGKAYALLLAKKDAVEAWRELLGPTNPAKAREDKPHSLRAVHGTDGLHNGLHGSESVHEAMREYEFVFSEEIKDIQQKQKVGEFQKTLLLLLPALVGNYSLPSFKVASITNLSASQQNLQITTEQHQHVNPSSSENINQIVYELILQDWDILRIDQVNLSLKQARSLLEGTCSDADIDKQTDSSCIAIYLGGHNVVSDCLRYTGFPQVEGNTDENSLIKRYNVQGQLIAYASVSWMKANRDMDILTPTGFKSTAAIATTEQTLAILKPDVAVTKEKEITDKILENGFKIAKSRKFQMHKETAEKLYEEHTGKPFFDELCEFMSSGPVVALVLEKEDGVAAWRSLLGLHDVEKAKESTPNSLRALFGTDRVRNAVYGSDSFVRAQRDISLIFNAEEKLPVPSSSKPTTPVLKNSKANLGSKASIGGVKSNSGSKAKLSDAAKQSKTNISSKLASSKASLQKTPVSNVAKSQPKIGSQTKLAK